ncbi:histidine phosphatase family protein [Capilliphycus salinus ALCB114379]|uniref:histidine phosphatase family protein n=1 Tax=Capilliphycus salinus TaxID=2768948 RepID=UPI0039A4A717
MKSIRRFLLLIGLSGVITISCTSDNSHRDLSHLSEVSSPIARTPASEPTPLPKSETSSATPTPTENTAPDIWEQMRQGRGYVVAMRHAQTVAGTGDPPGFELDNCATQRNLSQAGREQATRIGEIFRARQIPIHQVLSSQYCRCLDTAELLNLGEVEQFPALNSTFEDRTNEAEQIAQTRQQIVNHQNTSGVIIMVSHFANIQALVGVGLSQADSVVVKANSQGELEIVGQIEGL